MVQKVFQNPCTNKNTMMILIREFLFCEITGYKYFISNFFVLIFNCTYDVNIITQFG